MNPVGCRRRANGTAAAGGYQLQPGPCHTYGWRVFASTAGNTTYIAYNEIPEKKEGNTIVILNYDRLTHKYGKQQRIPLAIASKFPYPDAHVTPVIVTLGNGQQHVLVGPQAGDCYDYTRKLSEDAATDTFALAATLKGPRGLYDGNER